MNKDDLIIVLKQEKSLFVVYLGLVKMKILDTERV